MHLATAVADPAGVYEQTGWSSADVSAETQQRMFFKYKVRQRTRGGAGAPGIAFHGAAPCPQTLHHPPT
jgi:hypothetical protein